LGGAVMIAIIEATLALICFTITGMLTAMLFL
jgi:hypothetical protein